MKGIKLSADFNPDNHLFFKLPFPIFIVIGIYLYLIGLQAVPLWAIQFYQTAEIINLFVVFSLISIIMGLVAEMYSRYHKITLSFVAMGFYALGIVPLAFIGLLTAYVSTASVLGFVDILLSLRIIQLCYRIGFIAGTRAIPKA